MHLSNHRLFSTLLMMLTFILFVGCNRTPNSNSQLSTSNKTAQRIQRTLPRYARLAHDAWPAIYPDHHLPLKLGMQDPTLPMIRERLIKLGDLSPTYASKSRRFDQPLVNAVRQFQWRHGLSGRHNW